MRIEDIQANAAALIAVRQGGAPIDGLPFPPDSLADSYAIQDAVAVGCGPVGGWKMAPLPEGGVWCAPLHADTIRHRPTLSAATLKPQFVEVEIAFRMTQDIARGTSTEALRGQMVMVPLFEVLSSRLDAFLDKPFLSNLADGYGSALIGLGDEVPGWTSVDRAGLHLRVEADGETILDKDIADTLDFAVNLVASFAEDFCGRMEVLPKGTVVTTGAIKAFPAAGRIVADYGALGVNELRFEDL